MYKKGNVQKLFTCQVKVAIILERWAGNNYPRARYRILLEQALILAVPAVPAALDANARRYQFHSEFKPYVDGNHC